MTIPENICRVSMVWGASGTDEKFVNTVHVLMQDSAVAGFNIGGSWSGLTQQLADEWYNHMHMHHDDAGGSIASPLHSSIYLDSVHAYHLDTDGKTLDEGVHACAVTDYVGKTSGPPPLPFEVAVLIRLSCIHPGNFYATAVGGTGKHHKGGTHPAGRHKGRLYYGGVTTQLLDGSGNIGTTYRDNIANWWGVQFNEWDGMHLGTSGTVYPTTGVLSKAAGQFYPLDHISVPNLFGVQRRRQNQLTDSVSAGVTVTHGA